MTGQSLSIAMVHMYVVFACSHAITVSMSSQCLMIFSGTQEVQFTWLTSYDCSSSHAVFTMELSRYFPVGCLANQTLSTGVPGSGRR